MFCIHELNLVYARGFPEVSPATVLCFQSKCMLLAELKDKGRVEGCGKRAATVKGDRKPVTFRIYMFASRVFYTTFKMTLKLIIHVI